MIKKEILTEEDQDIEKNHIEKNDEQSKKRPKEVGGRQGLEPTRYGDWEKNGRCIDF
ncbi:MAG: hypothetical protein DRQ44_06135 [Gammaproteobacteria bacterium]|nr:MAG: hypothetical protein DRQ44_06135 [Gammaproteobacteria bacterium]